VNVLSAQSTEPDSTDSDWPSSPANSTGAGDRAIRSRAIRRATSDGSTARTERTAGG
jgi:hypothetical protein